MSHGFRRLGEVCDIIAGQHINAELYTTIPGSSPYLTGPADFGVVRPIVSKWTHCPKVFAAEGDVLLTVKGNGVGKTNLGCDAAIGRQLMALRPHRNELSQTYLFHLLRSEEERIFRLAQGATVPGIGKEDVASLRLPLPPLAQQRRIAEVLDQAEALRAKRRTALAKLDTLTQAIFLDLFGDSERLGWPEIPVSSLAANRLGSIRTGPFGSQLLHSEFVQSGVAVLGIDNAVHNEFAWSRLRYITERKFQQLRRYQVFPGDVLITIMGTCGRCAIVPGDIPKSINTKHLCCITLDQDRCLPLYLQACFLLHPGVLRHLGVRERGAVMPGLNMEIIKALPIPVPPIVLQHEFTGRLAAVERQKALQRASLAKLDALFASLQHRAFRGGL